MGSLLAECVFRWSSARANSMPGGFHAKSTWKVNDRATRTRRNYLHV